MCPCQRPGPTATRDWETDTRAGVTTPTDSTAPDVSGPETVSSKPSPEGADSTVRRSPVPEGSVHSSMCPNSACDTGDLSSPAVHTPLESEVQATDRPAPYVQAASTGSCLGDMKYTSEAGFGVDTT